MSQTSPKNLDPVGQERKFLHDLASTLSIAMLYAGVMKDKGQLSHLEALLQAHQELERMIDDRRQALALVDG